MKYTVYGTWDAKWTVEADSADEAEDLVDAGEAGDAEIDGYGVDNVVTHGKDYNATKRLVTGVKRLLCDYAYDLGGRMHYAGGAGLGSIDNGVVA
jgi:hypothetical protein